MCLPVPEKNQRQFNFCIIPQYADGINSPPEGVAAPDAIVWTVNDGLPKAAFSGNGQQLGTDNEETADKLVQRILNDSLPRTKVVRPDEREFVSAMPEAHRKGEKAFHVKAFRGSKEGIVMPAVLLPYVPVTKIILSQVISSSSLREYYSGSRNHWFSLPLKTSTQSHTHLSCSGPLISML